MEAAIAVQAATSNMWPSRPNHLPKEPTPLTRQVDCSAFGVCSGILSNVGSCWMQAPYMMEKWIKGVQSNLQVECMVFFNEVKDFLRSFSFSPS